MPTFGLNFKEDNMVDLLGKAIGGLGGGALNSLTNGIGPISSSMFFLRSEYLSKIDVECHSASIDGLVNGTVDTALNYTWRFVI